MALLMSSAAPNTSTTSGAVYTPPPSVGVQTQSPGSSLPKPTNTTSTPVPTTSVKDLSGQYANVNGTIYNKSTGQGYSNPQDFFNASGVQNFNNLKFDTTWKPPTTTSAGLQMPGSTNTPSTSTATSSSAGILPTLATSTNTGNPSSPTVSTTATGAPTGYTPPNNGTTGVSQGGIIGNLMGNAQNNPAYQTAQGQYNSLAQAISQNQQQEAQALALNGSNSIPLEFQVGRSGILQLLASQQQGALGQQENAAQTAAQNALTAQGQTTTGLQAAGNLNAPITNIQPGTLTAQPSQPGAGLGGTTTTSGAGNLASLIGQRPSASSPGTTEFYNTQTGQGFATPQALADFVNQQNPGIGATAQNVFSVLQNQGQGGSNIVGGDSGLNPVSQVNTIAQQVINHQLSPSAALSMGGSVANWSSLLNQAMTQANGGQPIDTSALQAQYDANQQTQTLQGNQKAAYQQASQQATNLAAQFGDLVTKYNLNPNQLNAANGVLQTIASQTSDPRYQSLSNYINDIVGVYANVLGSGGQATDFKSQLAGSFLNQLASGTALQQVLASIDQQAQAKIAGTQTPSTTGGSNPLGLPGF